MLMQLMKVPMNQHFCVLIFIIFWVNWASKNVLLLFKNVCVKRDYF